MRRLFLEAHTKDIPMVSLPLTFQDAVRVNSRVSLYLDRFVVHHSGQWAGLGRTVGSDGNCVRKRRIGPWCHDRFFVSE